MHGDSGGLGVTGVAGVRARVAALSPLDEQVGCGPVALLRDDADAAPAGAEGYHLQQGAECYHLQQGVEGYHLQQGAERYQLQQGAECYLL